MGGDFSGQSKPSHCIFILAIASRNSRKKSTSQEFFASQFQVIYCITLGNKIFSLCNLCTDFIFVMGCPGNNEKIEVLNLHFTIEGAAFFGYLYSGSCLLKNR